MLRDDAMMEEIIDVGSSLKLPRLLLSVEQYPP